MNNMAAKDMRIGKKRTKAGRRYQSETNQRLRTVIFLIVTVVILAAVTAAGILTEGYAVETDFSQDAWAIRSVASKRPSPKII